VTSYPSGWLRMTKLNDAKEKKFRTYSEAIETSNLVITYQESRLAK
jgi:hypothetical protein